MNKLANQLIQNGYLKTDLIIDAFSEISRREFVPSNMRDASEHDIPISIGKGQMVPAPSVIAFMIELLAPIRGQAILVAGFGGGWVSALLSYIVSASGHVTSVDLVTTMQEEMIKNMGKFHFIERDHVVDTHVIAGCDDIFLDQKFDRIIVINPVLASCDFSQHLVDGGVIVKPVDNHVAFLQKKGEQGELNQENYDSISFLPA